jgi:hypothetical protein
MLTRGEVRPIFLFSAEWRMAFVPTGVEQAIRFQMTSKEGIDHGVLIHKEVARDL